MKNHKQEPDEELEVEKPEKGKEEQDVVIQIDPIAHPPVPPKP